MSDSQENFEALQKLLALKRHEQPPPGYFDRLPDTIAARIHRETRGDRFLSSVQEWFSRFGFKPAVAYGVLTTLCALIVLGVGYSLRMDDKSVSSTPNPEDWWRVSASAESADKIRKPAGLALQTVDVASTNPVFNGSLFEGLKFRVEPVGFSPEH